MPYSGKIQTVKFENDDNENFQYLHSNKLVFNEERARDIEGVYLRIDKFIKRGMKITRNEKRKIKKRVKKKELKTLKKKNKGKSYSTY